MFIREHFNKIELEWSGVRVEWRGVEFTHRERVEWLERWNGMKFRDGEWKVECECGRCEWSGVERSGVCVCGVSRKKFLGERGKQENRKTDLKTEKNS
jgi:hypothetical protein